MATKPVDKRAVKRFYDRWVAAGRPSIAEFARQSRGAPVESGEPCCSQFSPRCRA